MHKLPDQRITPWREDLAAEHLRGTIDAPLYAQGQAMQVRHAAAPLRRSRDATLGFETEVIFGELIDIYELKEGWAWGQARRDGYVGFLPAIALGPCGPAATHRVIALRSFLYPVAGIKMAPSGFLPFGAEVHVLADEGDFARTSAGYLYGAHLTPLATFAPDPVSVAEQFLGTPYLWGGKTSLGLDCSALVQTACHACGIDAPRDSDMQEQALGEALPLESDPANYQRGELLFWPGHVAIAQGGGLMIHANAHAMMVTSEEIGPALARIAARGDTLRTVRRLSFSQRS